MKIVFEDITGENGGTVTEHSQKEGEFLRFRSIHMVPIKPKRKVCLGNPLIPCLPE